MISKVVSSVNADVVEAAQEVVVKLKAAIKNPQIAFVYSSVDYDQDMLMAELAKGLKGTKLIGNTSFTGVMTQEGFITGEKGFVAVMALADKKMKVGVAFEEKGKDAREIGQKLAVEAMNSAGMKTPPSFFYMVANPEQEESYLTGIQDIVGRVPMFGGSAADNTITGKWKLFTHRRVMSEGVAVAFFYTDSPIANYFTGAYNETNKSGIVTKMNGKRCIMEIDGVPALKKYAEWAGVSADSLKGGALLAASVTAPLGVKDRLGKLIAIRHPMNGNDDYSINVGNDVVENTAIIFMQGSVDDLIVSTRVAAVNVTELLLPSAATVYHFVHCGGRRAGIGDRIDEVYKGLKEVLGDKEFIMEFTFGEYGYVDSDTNTCGGLMLSFTAIG